MSDTVEEAAGAPSRKSESLRFTTEALPPAQRLSVWREEFGRTLLHADIEPVSDEPLHAEATMGTLPGVRSLEFRGSAMCFTRRQGVIAAGEDSIGLVVSRDDDFRLSQCRRDASLRAGDACLILTGEPGMVTSRAHLGLLFPRAPLVERVKNVSDFSALPIPASTEALRLFLSYLSAVSRDFSLDASNLKQKVVEHIYDLAALTIWPRSSTNDDQLTATAAARLEIALTYIKLHYTRPNLSITAVARDQNISPRYLQRLIETTGSTFSERIQELRLQHAHKLLTETCRGHVRISDVAMQVGFSDISHFNRSFRRRFGDTPRGVRTNARVRITPRPERF